MKFKFLFAMLIAFSLCQFSCSNNNTKSDKESDKSQNDTIIYNDNIQDTFFGTSFGTRKDTLIQNFFKHELITDESLCTDWYIPFVNYNTKFVSFGGYNWNYIDVSFSNDKFYSIRFHNTHKDKASALESYSNLLNAISSKYNMTEITPSDTTIYKKSIGYSNQRKK